MMNLRSYKDALSRHFLPYSSRSKNRSLSTDPKIALLPSNPQIIPLSSDPQIVPYHPIHTALSKSIHTTLYRPIPKSFLIVQIPDCSLSAKLNPSRSLSSARSILFFTNQFPNHSLSSDPQIVPTYHRSHPYCSLSTPHFYSNH